MSYIQELLGDAYKEGMSESEISDALKSAKIGKADGEITKLKDMLSKANSEASDYKKQLKAKMSESEKAEAERQEMLQQMQTELDQLKAEKRIADIKANLVGLGYGGDLAVSSATALANGDLEAFFNDQKEFLTGYKNSILADAMKGTPNPVPGQGTQTMTKEQFRKLDMVEKMNFYRDHPEEYKSLFEG
jgi:hypothetical protein